MTRKKEKLETEEISVQTPETTEVETLVEDMPKKEPKEPKKESKLVEPKKEVKSISDLEVARKLVNIHSSAQSRNLEFNLTFGI